MEGGMAEQDYDELEMLLGEIPNATSVDHNAGHHNPRVSSQVFDGIIQSNPISSYEIPEIGIKSDNCNLLDDMYKLVLAFKEVGIKENLATKPSSIHTFSMNDQNPKHLVKSQSGQDNLQRHETLYGFTLSSLDVEALSLNMRRNWAKQNEKYDGPEPMQILERLWDEFSDHQQVVPINTLSNSYHHNYFVDAEPPAYFYCSHLTQPVMVWNDMEQEKHLRSHKKYKCSQNFQNHKPGVGKSVNSMNTCFDLPISPQFDQHNTNPYSNAIAYPCELSERVDNLCSSHGHRLQCLNKDFQGPQVLDKAGMPFFPEKILTRFHGVNTLRILRPNPLANDQSLHFCQSLLMRDGSLHLDNLGFRGSSANNFNSRLASRSMHKNHNSVDEIVGGIYFIAKDQHGCRFLQEKMREGIREDIDKIFAEIIGHIVELMTDPFGNYLVQKFLDVCNEEQMMLILKLLTRKEGELIIISCDIHGTRSVQKVIETLQTDEQKTMVISSLKHGIVTLMKDINGNHVSQRCLQRLPEYCEFLFNAAIAHCFELATDRQGCCVLQKCILHPESDDKRRLMSEITYYSLDLSQDSYGNYVVQFVLDQKVPWASSLILKQLKGNYEHLSMQKYSSNVVEKCIKLAGEEERAEIIQELIHAPRLVQALHDPFGNYVIQSALRESKGDLHAALVEAIKPHFSSLKSSPYGKKVVSRASLFLK